MAIRIGLIGGTGLYRVDPSEPIDVETVFGDVTLHRTTLGGRETFFLPRHGPQHKVPAHRINHRAHIDALRAAHCDYILTVNNVGGIDPALRPGSFAVAKDFLDFHRGAPPTFHDDRAVHVDFTQPYCPTASTVVARSVDPELPRVVYAGTDGPRFETASEVDRLAQAGAQIVGMTGVPEAILAHERGLCFSSLCFIGNAVGLGAPPRATEIQRRLVSRRARLLKILETAARRLPAKKSCRCSAATRQAELTLGGRP